MKEIIKKAIVEDLGKSDVTSSVTVPRSISIKAKIIFKESGIVCGLPAAKEVFKALNPKIRFQVLTKEGKFVKKGKVVAVIKGPARSILAGERTALNFLGHLSGIATLTSSFAKKVRGTKAKIYDTRKTTPLLRDLEKYAVRTGGGMNHRMGLWDQVLVKENHIEAISCQLSAISKRQKNIKEIIKKAKKKVSKKMLVEVEVQNLSELKAALAARPDIILLDNMSVAQVKKAVQLRNKISRSVKLEVSGGITLKNVTAYARCGIERISIGCLTHSAPSLDVSLEVVNG